MTRPAKAGGIAGWIAHGAEILSAAIVVIEIGLLFAGMLSRYWFHTPISWVEEITNALFVWLIMLGAIIAMHRGQHMRLTLLIDRLSPDWRRRVDALAQVLLAAFLLGMLSPALDYVTDMAQQGLPTTHASAAWRVSAVLFGFAVMLLLTVLRLWNTARLADVTISVLLAAILGAALWGLAPALDDLGNINLLVFFFGLLSLFIGLGIPIAFAFGISTASYIALMTDAPLSVMIGRMEEGAASPILLAIPLFIFLGALLDVTGMARAILTLLIALIGHLRGGLCYVLLGAMYLVSGISGSKAADQAAIAPALLPEMSRRGANRGELAVLLAAATAMSETIPPSIVLIMLGSVAGVSIAKLFAAGLVPAAVLALILAVLARFRSGKDDLSVAARPSAKTILRSVAFAVPALVLLVLVRTLVLTGVATATEVCTVAILYTGVIGLLFYDRFGWSTTYRRIVDAASLTGAILLVVGIATAMGWALPQSGFASQLIEAVIAMPGGAPVFLLSSIAVFIVLGSILEGVPALILFAPLFFPAARALGISDVHYAMVVILAMGIGLFTPPFGIGFYATCAVADVEPSDAIPRMWIYVAALVVGVVVIAFVPWLSLAFV